MYEKSSNLIADLSAAEYRLASLADAIGGEVTASALDGCLVDAARVMQLCRECCPGAVGSMEYVLLQLTYAASGLRNVGSFDTERRARRAREVATRALGLVCLALHQACAAPDGTPAVDESGTAAIDALLEEEFVQALDTLLEEEFNRALDEPLDDDEFAELPDVGILYGDGEQDA